MMKYKRWKLEAIKLNENKLSLIAGFCPLKRLGFSWLDLVLAHVVGDCVPNKLLFSKG